MIAYHDLVGFVLGLKGQLILENMQSIKGENKYNQLKENFKEDSEKLQAFYD